jgi:hypothetical protein
MGRRFLYYLDSKLGCDHIKFIPMYEEDTIPQKELLDQFKADVKDKMTDAYVDDKGVFHFKCGFPQAFKFILMNIDKGLVTFSYDSYTAVKMREQMKKESSKNAELHLNQKQL